MPNQLGDDVRRGRAVGVTNAEIDDVLAAAAVGFAALTTQDFEGLVPLAPEVVLLGTGVTIRLPHPRLTRALTDARIGVEVMDTPAACRTFNILAAEGRRVAAAILIDAM